MCERILCDLPVNVTVDKTQDFTEKSDFDSADEVSSIMFFFVCLFFTTVASQEFELCF